MRVGRLTSSDHVQRPAPLADGRFFAARPEEALAPPALSCWVVASGLVAVILVAVVGVGYVWYRYNQIGREDLNLDEAVANEPQNYLIVGSDSRDVVDATDPDAKAFLGGNAEPAGKRSDTIMIARVDPDEQHGRRRVVPARSLGGDLGHGFERADQHGLLGRTTVRSG